MEFITSSLPSHWFFTWGLFAWAGLHVVVLVMMPTILFGVFAVTSVKYIVIDGDPLGPVLFYGAKEMFKAIGRVFVASMPLKSVLASLLSAIILGVLVWFVVFVWNLSHITCLFESH